MEGHPGLSLGHLSADPGDSCNGSSSASYYDTFAVSDIQAVRILVIDLNISLTGHLVKAFAPCGHCSRVILIEDPSRHQNERIILIRKLC